MWKFFYCVSSFKTPGDEQPVHGEEHVTPQDICQNCLPLSTLHRCKDSWEICEYKGCWGFIFGVVKPEVTEEPRNEGLVVLWLRWRGRHLFSLCRLFFFFARNLSWQFFSKESSHREEKKTTQIWFPPGGFPPLPGDCKRTRRAPRLQCSRLLAAAQEEVWAGERCKAWVKVINIGDENHHQLLCSCSSYHVYKCFTLLTYLILTATLQGNYHRLHFMLSKMMSQAVKQLVLS